MDKKQVEKIIKVIFILGTAISILWFLFFLYLFFFFNSDTISGACAFIILWNYSKVLFPYRYVLNNHKDSTEEYNN